jgi:hypothetical protein
MVIRSRRVSYPPLLQAACSGSGEGKRALNDAVHVGVFHEGLKKPRCGISPHTMPEREALGSCRLLYVIARASFCSSTRNVLSSSSSINSVVMSFEVQH